MLRLLSKITITQVTVTPQWPVRNKTFIVKFVNEIEINSSWQNLTDTCKIVMPKKVYVADENGKRVNWLGQSAIGSDTTVPLMLRGDKITIELGYNYPTVNNPEVIETNVLFDGFITRINPRLPIEIHCEDRMYQLKQLKLNNKVYSNKLYSVQDMIQEMLLQFPQTKDIKLITGSSIGQKIETNINDEFRTQDDTIASVLERLRKEARLNSYFRGNELRCSGIVYFPADREVKRFSFQKNIISDDLEFRRVEDIKLGAKCYSVNKTDTFSTNVNKSNKTKRKRLETFVGQKDGELRTLFINDVNITAAKYYNVTTPTDAQMITILQILGERELRKFYYTGFFGKFSTFGLPKVKHGDEIAIEDNILPERNGSYLCKGVRTSFGQGGFRQDIELHLKLSVFTQVQIANGL